MTALRAQPVSITTLAGRPSTLFERAATMEAIVCRVSLLILAIIMMGAVDLYCTLTYMRSVGMIEVNPIARYLVEVGGAGMLLSFKFGTMALSALVLFLARRHPRTEAHCWLGFGILLALMAHWVHYNATVPSITSEIVNLAAAANHCPQLPEAWVKLEM